MSKAKVLIAGEYEAILRAALRERKPEVASDLSPVDGVLPQDSGRRQSA